MNDGYQRFARSSGDLTFQLTQREWYLKCDEISGYIGSSVLPKHDWGTRIAMVYNVGMRNLSFAPVLAISYLPPFSAVPLTLLMLY